MGGLASIIVAAISLTTHIQKFPSNLDACAQVTLDPGPLSIFFFNLPKSCKPLRLKLRVFLMGYIVVR